MTSVEMLTPSGRPVADALAGRLRAASRQCLLDGLRRRHDGDDGSDRDDFGFDPGVIAEFAS
jgi:hypothetical protein